MKKAAGNATIHAPPPSSSSSSTGRRAPPPLGHLGHHGWRQRLHGAVVEFFEIEERGTTVAAEVRAGMVSFLTMSYILLVNPQILSQIGFPKSDVVVATAVSSGVASLTCGLFGNLPFGLAPGTGLSAYLSYGLVLSGVLSRPQAMTVCFLSGIAMGACALMQLSAVIMKVIPRCVKLATVVGMGLLIALIGMVSIRLVVPNTDTLVTLGDFRDYHIWLALVGLVMTGSLLFHQVKGGVLAGIVLITLIVWVVDGTGPTAVAEVPHLRYGVARNLDLSPASLSRAMVLPTLAFLFVGIFDVSGVMFGLASLARLVGEDGHHHRVPGSIWAFLSSALGTVVAAMAGCSPVIVHVESAAGIREGGRTGLTAVVVGLLFFASVFLAPLFGKVPTAATAPILILVGAMMIGESQHIDWADMSQAIPAFLTSMMMPFTFSIPNGILFGVGMSAVFFLTTGDFLAVLRGGGEGANPKPPSQAQAQAEAAAAAAAAAAGSWEEQQATTNGRSTNGDGDAGEGTHLLGHGRKPHPSPHRGVPTAVPGGSGNGAGMAFAAAAAASPSKRLSSSFFDEQPLTRRLSLLVPKEDADSACCELEQLAASVGGSGGAHVHPHHPHHAHAHAHADTDRQAHGRTRVGGSRGGSDDAGNGPGGGGIRAAVI